MTHTYPKTNGTGTCEKPSQFICLENNSVLIYCSERHLIKIKPYNTRERAKQAFDRQRTVLMAVDIVG